MRPTSNAAALPAPITASRPARAAHAVERSEDGIVTRADRIGFWIYVAMGILSAAFLVAVTLAAIVS